MLPEPPEDDGVYRRELAVRGFQEAVDRFLERLGDTDFWADPHRIHIPVTEALWWAISADEELELQLGKTTYRGARNADPNGKLLRGIRYVRNRCGHQRAIAPEDRSFRFDVPGRGFDDGELGPALRWRPASELPTPSDGFESSNAGLEPHYVQHLEGDLVHSTFMRVGQWFVEAQRRWPASP